MNYISDPLVMDRCVMDVDTPHLVVYYYYYYFIDYTLIKYLDF